MIKDFIKEANISILTELMHENSGFLPSKLITNLGFNRNYLKILEIKNIITKIDTGIYIDKTKKNDKYFILHLKYPKIIFSHFTALFINNLITKNEFIDITVDNKYHNLNLKTINVHYTSKSLIDIGKIKTKTPFGNYIFTYDIEKTICDIIKNKKNIDNNTFHEILKIYINFKNKNIENLKNYAKRLNIERKINALILSQI